MRTRIRDRDCLPPDGRRVAGPTARVGLISAARIRIAVTGPRHGPSHGSRRVTKSLRAERLRAERLRAERLRAERLQAAARQHLRCPGPGPHLHPAPGDSGGAAAAAVWGGGGKRGAPAARLFSPRPGPHPALRVHWPAGHRQWPRPGGGRPVLARRRHTTVTSGRRGPGTGPGSVTVTRTRLRAGWNLNLKEFR
jgi:hypothetical protein